MITSLSTNHAYLQTLYSVHTMIANCNIRQLVGRQEWQKAPS